jgi:hypothetical protein
LKPAYEAVSAVLSQQAIANVDETGWKQNVISHWLWTVVTPVATLFHINRSRGGAVWQGLLGAAFSGILGSEKVKAIELGKTLYQVRTDLFRDSLRAELRNPRICAL